MSIASKVLKNTLSNWAGMLINTVILFLLTPYLLGCLGDERYGIYQIVVPVVQYLTLLEFGLRGSISRFASKYIAAKDINLLNGIVSTAFCICVAIGLATVFISSVLGVFAPGFFNVAQIYEGQVLYVFLALGFNTAVSFLSYSFSGVLIGHNRYELLNLQLILIQLSKAILIVSFFGAGWVSLSSWALAIVLSSLIGITYLAAVTFALQKGLHISLRRVNLASFKELIGFSSWNMLLQVSGLVIFYFNHLIIGRYMGPGTVPYYAIPFMLVTQLQGLVMGLSVTMLPLASSTLASGDMELMRRLLRKGTYVASMMVFPLGGVLLVMCKDLFKVWLPAGYESSWVVYGILMIAFFGSISQTVSFFLMVGGGNIRTLATVYFAAGLAIVALGIYFVGYTGLGLIGAALAIVIPRLISACAFLPWYACRQVKLPFWRYIIGSYSRPVLCALPSVVLAALLIHYLPPSNLAYWILEFFTALLPYAVFALTGVLDWPMREKMIGRLLHVFRVRKVK